MEHIKLVTELRIKADSLMEKAELKRFSGETTLAWRSLQMAKCWLGKLKGALGAKNPYPVVDEVYKITPTEDVSTNDNSLNEVDNKLAFLNSMRADIQSLIDELEEAEVYGALKRYAIKDLMKARFWYGFELGKLRDD